MKISVRISRGIESLFGTRDENIRLLEQSLGVTTRLREDSLELEGEDAGVLRAESILNDYVSLVKEGQVFTNGDLHSYLRVVTGDAQLTLRGLVESGRQRNFGKKVVAPKTVNAAHVSRCDRALRPGVRRRTGGYRQDVLGGGDGSGGAAEQAGVAGSF